MKKDVRTAVYDEDLKLEAFCFQGIMQPFPNHFHEYYVIGFVEKGERRLFCRNQEYIIRPQDLLLFNPGDNHACSQRDHGALDYRGLNIKKDVMMSLAEEISGRRELPGFSENVIRDEEVADCLRPLHEMIMNGSGEFEKEENLILMMSLLFQKYGRPFEECIPECQEEIERACGFMEEHYGEHISLDQICRFAGLSKSALLRAFTRSKGITPYRYLMNIRIGAAKRLLEQGAAPVEAAMETGFSDQSHFTNCFTSFIGLPPGIYRDIFMKKKDGDR